MRLFIRFTLIHEVTLYIFINHFHFIFIMHVTYKALHRRVGGRERLKET